MSNSFDFGTGNIALAFDVPFPSNVDPGPGIEIDKTGATWTVGLGYPPLAENTAPTPSINYVAVYDSALDLYQKARIDTLVSTATGLDTRTVIGDADHLALSTDRYLAIATPLTLNRTLTLPPAASTPGGREILVQDEIGTLAASHYLVVKGTGTDVIDGRAQRILSTAYGGLRMRCNGSNAWSIIATTSLTPVNDTNYVCNSDDKVVAYTALTAARTVTLPSAASFPPGQRLVVLDQAGACSATHTITVQAAGTDTLNGIATSPALNVAYAFLGLVSDGLARWTVVDAVGVSGGGVTVTASQITDASALGRLLLTQTTAALDRTSLGSGTTGDAMFLSNSPSAGRAVLGSGACGDNVFISVTQAAAQSAMGLGTMATQNANNVAITGGTITGVTGIGGGASITMSDTAPGSPTSGSLWYDTAGGNLYVWYNDGTSSQWVVANNAGNAFLSLAGGTITGNLTVTGTTTVVTPAPGDNTTKAATTAFVGAALTASASAATPAMNGTAAPGVSALFARGDHVHPVDTSRASQASLANYLPLTGGAVSGTLSVGSASFNNGGYGYNSGALQTYLSGAVTIANNAILNAAATYVGALGSTLNSFGGNGSYVWGSGHYSNWSGGGSAFCRVDTTAANLMGWLWGAGSLIATITTNGSTVAYNTGSDLRLKKNVRDLASDIDVGDLIDRMRPVAFDWRDRLHNSFEPGTVLRALDGMVEPLRTGEREARGSNIGHGFVAQELIRVAPFAVHAPDDGQGEINFEAGVHPWGVDFSKLVPYLVAEIQSLRKRVAELESRS